MRRGAADLLVFVRRFPGRGLVAAGLFLALSVTPVVFDAALYDDFTLPKQASLLVAAALVLVGLAMEGRLLPRQRVLRFALLAWVAMLGISWATGIDPLGSVLGYYQYRQGLLTQLAYVVLFAGALQAARWLPMRTVLSAGAAGIAGVTSYTALQATGNDPFTWWIDTHARAFGTIGNANELAAYAVMALALAGIAVERGGRWGVLAAGGIAAASGYMVLAGESRSGLIALALVVVAVPAAGLVARWPGRDIALRTGLLMMALAIGFALSALSGAASGTANRVEAGVAQSDPSGSTRMQLWRGTVTTIEASPFVGFGPDGLYRAFPMHRPGDLEGAFKEYDLVAQSSHNIVLDTAVNEGLIGLAALLTLVTGGLWLSLRHGRRSGGTIEPYAWAAIAGYGALTLVNPVSLAPQALFVIVLGLLAGRAAAAVESREERGTEWLPVWARGAIAAPAALAIASVAVLLPLADGHADAAWAAYAQGDFPAAAKEAAKANDLMPVEPAYLRREGVSWLAAGIKDGRPALLEAERTLSQMDDRFPMTSSDAIALATAKIGLRRPSEEIAPVIDQVLKVNPYGVFLDRYTQRLRTAAERGAVLRYQPRDRWVFVDTGGEVLAP